MKPIAIKLHPWHNLDGVAIHVPQRRLAHNSPRTPYIGFVIPSGCLIGSRGRFSSADNARCLVSQTCTLSATRELLGCHRWWVLRYGVEPYRYLAGYSAHTPLLSVRQAQTWWYKWHFYLQSSGHASPADPPPPTHPPAHPDAYGPTVACAEASKAPAPPPGGIVAAPCPQPTATLVRP